MDIMDIEDKLSKIRFKVDHLPHIRIVTEKCEVCPDKACLYVCPVKNYRLKDDGCIEFSWQGCVECGACRIICPSDAVEWHYPRGGYGVCLRYG